MAKKRKVFGLGFKNGGGKRRKKKVTISKSGWGSKEPEEKEVSDRLPVAPPTYDVQELEIADIKIQGERRALNPGKVSELVQSISVLGLRDPITVRLVRKQIRWGEITTEYILVDGLHRLEAMKQAGHMTIPCFIIEADKRGARMWEISSSLHRADLTPVEYDEQLAEWVRLFEEGQAIVGQKVRKKGPGRPKSGIAEAARRLPVKGKTPEAKRKRVERAVKGDSIFPEAKDAASKAGVYNRSNRLKIAAKKSVEDQLAMVGELAAQKTKKTTPKKPLSAADEKVLANLLKIWDAGFELKRAFIKASPTVREQFAAKILRDRSH